MSRDTSTSSQTDFYKHAQSAATCWGFFMSTILHCYLWIMTHTSPWKNSPVLVLCSRALFILEIRNFFFHVSCYFLLAKECSECYSSWKQVGSESSSDKPEHWVRRLVYTNFLFLNWWTNSWFSPTVTSVGQLQKQCPSHLLLNYLNSFIYKETKS